MRSMPVAGYVSLCMSDISSNYWTGSSDLSVLELATSSQDYGHDVNHYEHVLFIVLLVSLIGAVLMAALIVIFCIKRLCSQHGTESHRLIFSYCICVVIMLTLNCVKVNID